MDWGVAMSKALGSIPASEEKKKVNHYVIVILLSQVMVAHACDRSWEPEIRRIAILS
jgi:hypothetical protein